MWKRATIVGAALLAVTIPSAFPGNASSPVVPKDDAARIEVAVLPETLAAGAEAEVTVRVVPASGIKINRYPRIRLSVASREGLLRGGDASVGSDTPPDPDHMEKNYFKSVEPVTVKVVIDPHAASGRHEVDGLLRYTYCVAASGYCAPVRTPVKIALTVR
jgi:hypothetical protein